MRPNKGLLLVADEAFAFKMRRTLKGWDVETLGASLTGRRYDQIVIDIAEPLRPTGGEWKAVITTKLSPGRWPIDVQEDTFSWD